MPTCVESAGDDRLWKGVGEKKQVQQSGAMRTGLLDGKKAAIPGIFTARFRFFLKKREVFLCFQVLVFRGSDLFGGVGFSYPRDRLSRVLLFSLPLLLGLATAGEGSCALPFAF